MARKHQAVCRRPRCADDRRELREQTAARYAAERELRGLRDDVSRLQHELVEIGSRRINQADGPGQLLIGFYVCKSETEVYAWLGTLPEKLLAFANVDRPDDWLDQSAFCPLCGEGKYTNRGYSYPEGLYRHLRGWGNSRQCPVTRAAESLARALADRRSGQDEPIT
jgi:hypothetical protein